ncbi:MAG TPA: beta-aspartyl-peptidase [Bacteroidales bacterium]|jgi:beta-aspartyl-peptidase (threonine type)|nr:beta-aspartyl-peptidase [Bacteroidales bacterium]
MFRPLFFSLLSIILFIQCSRNSTNQEQTPYNFALAIHGGAGNLDCNDLDSLEQHAYRMAINSALNAGVQVLNQGGSACDAVVEVVCYLEDNPLFNAGKGAVFTNKGTIELDASIMRGLDLNAGAVASVSNIKNPIKAALRVMDSSKHVLLAGSGASEFAQTQHLELVEQQYYFTTKSYQRYLKAREDDKQGTVGCVALDKYGNLCAGTSTGGMSNKKYGRIGDSPIIGAGTYANNATCGISATGHGEFFIRYNVAHDISALMEYKELTLEQAAQVVILEKLVKEGANGGVVCLDTYGRPAMVFNTTGMFRGYANSEGDRIVRLFKESQVKSK